LKGRLRPYLLSLALSVACTAIGQTATAKDVASASLALATSRYDHGVLGDAVEWGALDLKLSDGTRLRLTLPESRVFEDVSARVVDVDGDGSREVLVVETDLQRGASLAVYGPEGLRAATPFIGTRHRWLAPLGVADLDGDGRIEIAYVDRPHLLRELVVARLDGNTLTEVARLGGLSNHRIGDRAISGGIRDCGGGPELVLADAAWSNLMAVTFDQDRLVARQIALGVSARQLSLALACRS
jgi:hypothetical protein